MFDQRVYIWGLCKGDLDCDLWTVDSGRQYGGLVATEGELKTEGGWRQSGTEDLNISRSALPQYPGQLFQARKLLVSY